MPVVTRASLHEKVWQKPMSKLAEDFGISDRGLAKICARYAIPTPKKGHWAKLRAGKAVEQEPLPRCPDGLTETITILQPEPRADRVVDQVDRVVAESADVSVPAIPQTLRNPHWIVAGWVNEHKARQEKWRAEKRARPEALSRVRNLYPDLTERDRYRLQVTSALLNGLEANGCRAVQGGDHGKLLIETPGGQIEITVAEKMRRVAGKPADEQAGWTAFHYIHGPSLAPTGYLRVSITTFVGDGAKRRWVETAKAMAEDLLPQIVAGVLDAGAALRVLAERREEWRRRQEAEERERFEQRRVAQIEADRWDKFRKLATAWEEAQRLRAFLSAAEAERDQLAPEIDGLSTADWLVWARRQIDDLDPLCDGSAGK